ncbi:hypothetical protein F4823DRAFT_430586 [Ustulina deusta]|nr:hypothetical protein F4823DRAFT_430586 [Ustulina deusta]
MDFFCVRSKPRHFRGNHHRKEIKKDKEKTYIVQVEARPRVDPTRRKKLGKERHHRSGAMAHPHPRAESLAPSKEQHCPCASCRSQLLCSPTGNSNRENGLDIHLHEPRDLARENPSHLPQSRQVYVHPYSAHHYRFSVVDHSTTCHGHRLSPYPACYTALVPEASAVQDIEAALVHRPGLVGMVRLWATEELVHIGTFHCIKSLHEASLQLEVWDSDNAANEG